MKCPICGEELTLSKKNPGYALCHNCRKKFRLPKKTLKKAPESGKPKSRPDEKPPVKPAGRPKSPVLDDEMTDRTQVFSREEVRAALRKANSERKAEKAAQRAAAKSASRKASAASRFSGAEDLGTSADEDNGEYHFRYANIPPKEVREKQEREMRKAYDELLSIGEEERSSKKRGLFGRRK